MISNATPVQYRRFSVTSRTKGPSLYYVRTFLEFFWTTHPSSISKNSTYWMSAKLAIFLTHPWQSLCWRNIGMVPSTTHTYVLYVALPNNKCRYVNLRLLLFCTCALSPFLPKINEFCNKQQGPGSCANQFTRLQQIFSPIFCPQKREKWFKMGGNYFWIQNVCFHKPEL